ncbi:L,D-transpeptidase family protein [Peptoniphilus stercorisuis]|uniref:Lipoprotein-anchoring transpeptidase ErfK/SrfK n=1 Tax=Peptoniphilus stercorisuis TaxID=1436965 RepID=A0ABS4KDY0_9FIRM|nr:L,D-transpeptidase family protein [Peptoniphilus stercorisuis]MBP2025977.1 lipoprotein-anchoring transpeptidase ErfK/SrfK [Peptoniphilus stercorisuis]
MKKALRFSVVFILAILILVYISGIYIFGRVFLPNTYVNDLDVSLTKTSDLHKTYNNSYKNFELEIIKRDGSEKIKSSSFDYKDELDEKSYVEQNPFYWFVSFLVPKHYNLEHNISIDKDKFNNVIENLELWKDEVIEPQDAKIVYKNNKFEIEEEIKGNKLNKEKLVEKILDYIDESKKKLNLEEEEIYYSPVLTSKDPEIIEKAKRMNELNSFTITYDFDDRKEVLQNEELLSLYMENENKDLVPNIEKAREYILSLSKKYDTFKKTRTFQTTDKGIAEIQGGIYGWSTDIEKSTEELVKALEGTKTVEIKPQYKLDAQSRKVNDIGNSYVEIDIARQHMWIYRDGNLVLETDIVTGNPNKGNGTPTGVGKIWSRERDRYLSGEGYKSHVNYWLPFNWSGCGIHDSSWRSDYGKNIYLSRGSHGCVNTPPSLMPKFYENTFHGMPVVVYDSNTQIISSENK